MWDLRYESATSVPGDRTTEQAVVGPVAPPGRYQVRLTVGGESQTRSFDVLADPNVRATREELDAQFEFLIRIRDRLSATNAAINRMRNIQRQVREWTRRAEADDAELDETIASLAQRVLDALDPIELALVQRDSDFDADRLMQAAGLNQKLAAVTSVASSADAVPTRPSRDVFATLEERIDEQLAALDSVVEGDLAELNRLIGTGNVAAVDSVSAQPPASD